MKAASTVTTIGLAIAKSVFQVHGIDAEELIVVRQQFKCGCVLGFFAKLSPCMIGIEACASSHHWARALTKLGREVMLMPLAYVKP
jgi:transposase